MPELPEVEVIRRGLAPLVIGKEFTTPLIHFHGAVHYPEPEQFCRLLRGRRIREVDRKGKHLLFLLDRGMLLAHLRMTGMLIYRFPGEKDGGCGRRVEHLRLKLPFTGGGALCFYDQRKFGGFRLLEKDEEWDAAGLPHLGPDMWEEADEITFLKLLQSRPRARIKPLLLDQGFVAGMGNIYTDESLFRSGIHPCRPVSSLTKEESRRLYRAIREVLARGIACGGTTTRDYRDARGAAGLFQEQLAVYGCKGEPCPRCGRLIERTVTAGRGTYYCPHCQS